MSLSDASGLNWVLNGRKRLLNELMIPQWTSERERECTGAAGLPGSRVSNPPPTSLLLLVGTCTLIRAHSHPALMILTLIHTHFTLFFHRPPSHPCMRVCVYQRDPPVRHLCQQWALEPAELPDLPQEDIHHFCLSPSLFLFSVTQPVDPHTRSKHKNRV